MLLILLFLYPLHLKGKKLQLASLLHPQLWITTKGLNSTLNRFDVLQHLNSDGIDDPPPSREDLEKYHGGNKHLSIIEKEGLVLEVEYLAMV